MRLIKNKQIKMNKTLTFSKKKIQTFVHYLKIKAFW